MNRLVDYFKGAWGEITTKMTWSGFQELQNSAILVLVSSLIFAIVIGIIDFGFSTSLDWFYRNF